MNSLTPMAQYEPERLLEVLARHRVHVVLVAGSEHAAPGGDVLASVLEVLAERSMENVRALCAAFVELDATLFIGDAVVGERFRRVPAIVGRSWVWNITSSLGRINLSFLPPGDTGFSALLARAKPVQLGQITVPAADLLGVIPFKALMRDRWVLPTLGQIGQWQDELEVAERQQSASSDSSRTASSG